MMITYSGTLRLQ